MIEQESEMNKFNITTTTHIKDTDSGYTLSFGVSLDSEPNNPLIFISDDINTITFNPDMAVELARHILRTYGFQAG